VNPVSSASASSPLGSGRSPQPYDFRRPIQLSREHARLLHVAFEGFARQASTVFTAALRSVTTVGVVGVEQMSYGEYVTSLPARTYLTLFDAEPVSGRGMLEIGLGPTMTCVDHMLGGSGGVQPVRQLTDIESTVFGGLVERLLGEMRYALADLAPLSVHATGVEYSPHLAQVAGPADVMVVVRLDLDIAGAREPISLCLPFAGLHPHLVRASAPTVVSERERALREVAAGRLRRRFDSVPVEVGVRLRTARLSPDRLAALQLGDVVRLDHPASAPMTVVVDDQHVAHATLGASGKRLAALVVDVPEPGASPYQEDR
jgi:flagellar motor switch protein FliM